MSTRKCRLSTLLSINTGGCQEDCANCPQAAQYLTAVKAEKLMDVEAVLAVAGRAKAAGASRFCDGRGLKRAQKDKDPGSSGLPHGGRGQGAGAGKLRHSGHPGHRFSQAQKLKQAGLDYYNHNLDTSPEYYRHIITPRTYQDRRDTLAAWREAAIHVCCGGIVGLGDAASDRVGMIAALATLNPHPESVPIKRPGGGRKARPAGVTEAPLDPIEFVRTIAVARIALPASVVRLSAGRESRERRNPDAVLPGGSQFASFTKREAATTPNPETHADRALFARLGLNPHGSKSGGKLTAP